MSTSFDPSALDDLLARIAHDAPRHFGEGQVASYIPALAEVVPDQFGIAVCDVAGRVYRAGAADTPFSIQSISKLLNLIIAIQHLDEADIWQRVGREPSGQAFNSIVQLEVERGIPRNPFINAGALLVTDLLVSRIMSIHWVMRELARRLAGNPGLGFDTRVASSEMAHKARNAALAYLMKAYGNLHGEVDEVLDVYFHGCALSMSCVDVARAFAFLANRGVHPGDGSVIVTPQQNRQLNALLLTCGLYDAAGDFAWRVGLPGKSGVGGGIVAIVPGQMSLCVWSPRLDSYGNSVTGLRALETLVEGLGVAPLG